MIPDMKIITATRRARKVNTIAIPRIVRVRPCPSTQRLLLLNFYLKIRREALWGNHTAAFISIAILKKLDK
jgi:hypothetical protein